MQDDVIDEMDVEEVLPTYEEEPLVGYYYEGSLEEYEDPADSFVIKGLRGSIIA